MEEKKRRPRLIKTDSDSPLQERDDSNTSFGAGNDYTPESESTSTRSWQDSSSDQEDTRFSSRRPSWQDQNSEEGSGGYQQRPYQQRPYQDRNQGEGGGYQQRPYQQRPYQDRNQGEGGGYQQRPYQQRPYQDRNQGEGGGYQQRPYQQRPYQDRNQGEGGGYQQRPYQDRNQGGGYQQRPYQDRNQGGGGYQQRPYQDRNQGGGYQQRPYQDRSQGGGYQQRPYQDRSQGGGYQQRPYQDRNQGGGYQQRPWQDRSQGGGYQQRPQRGGFNARPQKPRRNKPQEFYIERLPKPDLPTGEGMPLNKYLAHCGIASRRKAVELIEQGLVTVNGAVVTEPYYRFQLGDVVTCEGKDITIQERMIYVLLNKPKGVITTTDDEKGRATIMDIVDPHFPERIYPVGRLDRDTTGLILLTNDGDLAQKLTHPSFHVQKQYRVGLDQGLTRDDYDRIIAGIELEDGTVQVNWVRFAEDHPMQDVVELEITMGRNRIVRRLFESLGYEVKRLDRFYFGGLTKKDLARGAFRELTQREIIMLKHFTGQPGEQSVLPESYEDAGEEEAATDDFETA